MTAAATTTTEECRFRMTYQQRLSSDAESRRVEWAQGEAVAFVPPTIHHARLVLFLSILVSLFAGRRRLGAVLVSPFEMRLSAKSSREPKIAFVTAADADRIGEKRVDGALTWRSRSCPTTALAGIG